MCHALRDATIDGRHIVRRNAQNVPLVPLSISRVLIASTKGPIDWLFSSNGQSHQFISSSISIFPSENRFRIGFAGVAADDPIRLNILRYESATSDHGTMWPMRTPGMIIASEPIQTSLPTFVAPAGSNASQASANALQAAGTPRSA
jgi:hypothetical protein